MTNEPHQKRITIRSHRLGDVMTGEKKPVEDSVTTVKYLRELHRAFHWNRKKIVTNKYIQKGLSEEEMGITLYSRFKKIPMFKNTVRYTDELLTGEPDITFGDGLRITHGADIKCSWSFDTFPFKEDKLDSDYIWQNHAYIMLTGAEYWTTVYVLVNAPASLIEGEKKKYWYSLGCPDYTHPVYVSGCINIERNMIYDMPQFVKDNPEYLLECSREWNHDIPISERVMEFRIDRDEDVIKRITKRLQDCYTYLNKL